MASAIAGQTGVPEAVALWAAAVDTEQTYGTILGSEVMAKGHAAAPDELVKAKLSWGAEIDLNGAFFDGVAQFNTAAEIAGYEGPLFVAQGSKDTLVSPDSAAILITAHEGPKRLGSTIWIMSSTRLRTTEHWKN